MRLIDADHLRRWIIARWQEIDPCSDRPFRADEILDQIDREFSIDMVWTTEEVAEILARVLGDECACNFNGIDEWLPSACKYADTECPTPKEKHGCWIQFLMQGGADMRTKETDNDYERAVDQLEHDISYEPTFNQDDGSM